MTFFIFVYFSHNLTSHMNYAAKQQSNGKQENSFLFIRSLSRSAIIFPNFFYFLFRQLIGCFLSLNRIRNCFFLFTITQKKMRAHLNFRDSKLEIDYHEKMKLGSIVVTKMVDRKQVTHKCI